MIDTIKATSSLFKAGSFTCLIILTACASRPPTQALQAAEQAITRAEQMRGTTDYPSPELAEAREKMAAAQSAVQQKDMISARHLAEQAQLDAELASAKAETNKAQSINNELQKSIDAMKQEMQRNPNAGAKP